jgi:hypothetical protein
MTQRRLGRKDRFRTFSAMRGPPGATVDEVAGRAGIRLRLDPALNDQAMRIRCARHYEFERSIRSNWLSRLGISD